MFLYLAYEGGQKMVTFARKEPLLLELCQLQINSVQFHTLMHTTILALVGYLFLVLLYFFFVVYYFFIIYSL